VPSESQCEALGKIVKPSPSVAGHRTSISLESAFGTSSRESRTPWPFAVTPAFATGQADLKCLAGAAEQRAAFALFGGCVPATAVPLFRRDQAVALVAPYFEALSTLPETPDALDQRGVIGDAGAVGLDAAWRQAHDRALAALEMPGIVVVLGPSGVRGPFLHELMAAFREHGRAVTFVPRADLMEPPAVAGSTLVIEDAARMDAEACNDFVKD